MMKWFFTILLAISVISGFCTGKIEAVSNAAVQECGNAVQLALSLMGIMCLWSGIMKVAVRSGLTDKLARLFSPLLRVLFPDVTPHSKAAQAISMNLTANLLGLGNAVTPLGIAAMKELDALNPHPTSASTSMILLAVLNTASMQLLPTTIAALRLSAGSAHPLDILPAVWISSFLSVCTAVLMVKALRGSTKQPVSLPAAGRRCA